MTTSPRVRVLQRLADNPQGLHSFELLAMLGETDSAHRHRLAAVLQALKVRNFVTMTRGASNYRGGATYAITEAGIAKLAKLVATAGETLGDDEVVLPTGAMRGEQPTILRTTAVAGQVVGVITASPFARASS